MSNTTITYLQHHEIDFEKWDRCIAGSFNGNAYAWSWYLNYVSVHWDALVFGDYLYVMPLVWNKKYGWQYIYQPFFTQQLGVFSVFPTDQEMVISFLQNIPPKFRLVEMSLNYQNIPPAGSFAVKSNITYHLPLGNTAEAIRKKFSTNTRRNIKKAGAHQLVISSFYNTGEFIAFTKNNLQDKSPEIKDIHYQNLKKIVGHAIYHRQGEIYAAFNTRNQLVAAAFFIRSHQKIIYLAASSSGEGIDKKAMFLLVDHFIENHAGTDLTLDFEGSNIPGVARFYEGFGARAVHYFSIRRDTLPWFIRLFKR